MDAASIAVVFLDLQEKIVTNSRTVTPQSIGIHAGVLAKLAKLHGIPVFLSGVPQGEAYLKDVLEPVGSPAPFFRTATTAFADAKLIAEIRNTRRRTLILAGVASEIVVQRTALDGVAADFAVQVAVDACGGLNPRTEDAAWRRIVQAGGVTTSVTTLAAELAGDFTTEIGGATLALMYETLAG